jgi:hypothetical protein
LDSAKFLHQRRTFRLILICYLICVVISCAILYAWFDIDPSDSLGLRLAITYIFLIFGVSSLPVVGLLIWGRRIFRRRRKFFITLLVFLIAWGALSTSVLLYLIVNPPFAGME